MISAFIDAGAAAGERRLFRGRNLSFWIQQAFPNCRFLETDRRNGKNEPVLVFSANSFPMLSAAAGSELRRWLQDGPFSQDGFFSPAGKPFFAVSRAFLKKKGIRLETGVFRMMRAFPGVRELPLRNPVQALDPAREPLQVEAAVVALQLSHLGQRGVHVEDFGRFYLEGLPVIGRGSRIGSGVVIKGDCCIGRHVSLAAHCYVENSQIGDNCVLLPGSVILDSRIEKNVQLGPYCHVRLSSLVRAGAKIGNFVEMKKSAFGQGSKAMHLSYIGDATIGRAVNIGAGTITCNYDGKKKNPTFIGDNVFIGSGTELVAPVTVRRDSYVAAGSTITENVPRHALAVARQRQRNIKGWVLRKKKK